MMSLASQKELKSNYEKIQERISSSCKLAKRKSTELKLIAVSKNQDAQKIRYLHSLGQIDFGENYFKELETKTKLLSDLNINWIFIGQLQSNKIQNIVKHAHEIHSVASLKHARYIHRYAEELGKEPYPIYLSVNTHNEKNKAGLDFGQIDEIALQIKNTLPSLKLMGLMALPPKDLAEQNLASIELKELYSELKSRSAHIGLGKLSLGMSKDLESAVLYGSTCLRIGRALLGDRETQL